MTPKTEAERLLFERWQFAKDLREEFPYMDLDLMGQFALGHMNHPKFEVWENGNIVTRTLEQPNPEKDPDVGIILPGEYDISNCRYRQTFRVLDGELEASIDNGPISILHRDGAIVLHADRMLHLKVKSTNQPCFYICTYKPRYLRTA